MNLLSLILARVANSSAVGQEALRSQVERIKMRTEAGLDYRGRKFTPLVKPTKSGRTEPLVAGLGSFDQIRIGAVDSSDGASAVVELSGRGAFLAQVHDSTRPWFRVSESDMQEIARDIADMVLRGKRR